MFRGRDWHIPVQQDQQVCAKARACRDGRMIDLHVASTPRSFLTMTPVCCVRRMPVDPGVSYMRFHPFSILRSAYIATDSGISIQIMSNAGCTSPHIDIHMHHLSYDACIASYDRQYLYVCAFSTTACLPLHVSQHNRPSDIRPLYPLCMTR